MKRRISANLARCTGWFNPVARLSAERFGPRGQAAPNHVPWPTHLAPAPAAVYIATSGPGGLLYIGVARRLGRRMADHRDGAFPGFPKVFGCTRLVWFEQHASLDAAIERERP